jgi:tetratricopeptide (TPR) repeat protein
MTTAVQNKPLATPTAGQDPLAAGLAFLRAGRPVEAERQLRRVANEEPSAQALRLQAEALLMLGRHDDALAALTAALKLAPADGSLHHQRGCLLHQLGRLPEARQDHAAACERAPASPEFALELGNVCKDAGDFTAAVAAYDRAVALRPNYPEAFNNRATAQRSLGRGEQALADFSQAIRLNPAHLFAYLNRAALLADLRQLDAARADFEMAIVLAPDNPHTFYGLGEVLHQQGQHRAALAVLDAAALLTERMPMVQLSRGNCLQALGDFDAAIAAYRTALAIDPSFIEAYVNWGNALQELGRHTEAIAIYDQALAIRPGYHGAAWNRANSLLCLGLDRTQWLAYERRHQVQRHRLGTSPAPLLGDTAPDGQRLLLVWDQRFGDIIQCLRFVPEINRRARHCTWQVAKPMRDLVEASFPDLHLVDDDVFSGDIDYRLPITSLPLALGVFDQTLIPAAAPYLHASDERRRFWGAALPARSVTNSLRVGLMWRGQPVPPGRSIPLEQLEPLLRLPGLQFCALQPGTTPAERELLSRRGVMQFGDCVRSFHDTAAIIELLDLVVTIDTSVAHLAGALGKPAKVLLKAGGDWRWHTAGAYSAWYPGATLYRQTRPGDWATPIAELVQDLSSIAPVATTKLLSPENQP